MTKLEMTKLKSKLKVEAVARKDSEKLRRLNKLKIDLIIEKEHFAIKKRLCSIIKCSHWRNCPFYRDPEGYEKRLIKDKLSRIRCTYRSDYPNILEKLDSIKTGSPNSYSYNIHSIAKKTFVKKTTKAVKTLVKKDLQKQLLSFDKVLNEISERWRIQI